MRAVTELATTNVNFVTNKSRYLWASKAHSLHLKNGDMTILKWEIFRDKRAPLWKMIMYQPQNYSMSGPYKN
ncbi:MAG: hypothetical protein K0S20_308 [Patescibacteria group bacterium]|nr:hypothetical protein [Patescibacteria group bacterium]